MNKIRILVVDDTALYRKIIKDTLMGFSNVEVVGTASNGKIALSQVQSLKPDLMTLDLEMPEMNGLQTLRQLKSLANAPKAIMVSAHTTKDAAVTMQALDLGAFDFIAKPSGSSIAENVAALKDQFNPVLRAFSIRYRPAAPTGRQQRVLPSNKPIPGPVGNGIKPPFKPDVVVIGVSTGGPKALADVVPNFDKNLRVPVLIVQHMPPLFTKALADSLDKKSVLKVEEAANGVSLKPGHVYIAPGGKQMKIKRNGGILPQIGITDDPPENFCKPAVDYLFRSASDVYGEKTLAVIMTGMGKDGTAGLQKLKQEGAKAIAQDKETSTVFGMPMEAIKAGVVDCVVPLGKIATEINRICRGF